MTAAPARKAFLLAAGPGTRLGALTRQTPKCLLPVDSKPMLAWGLKSFEGLGVAEARANTHHLAAQVEEFARKWKGPPSLSLSHEPKLLGSAGALRANRDFFGRDDAFWIAYADTRIKADLRPLLELHRERGAVLTLGLFHAADPKSCGIVELGQAGKAVSFEEKPARPKGDLAFAGVAVGSAAFIERLPPTAHDLAQDVLGGSLEGVFGLELQGEVIDIGTPQSYQRALRPQ